MLSLQFYFVPWWRKNRNRVKGKSWNNIFVPIPVYFFSTNSTQFLWIEKVKKRRQTLSDNEQHLFFTRTAAYVGCSMSSCGHHGKVARAPFAFEHKNSVIIFFLYQAVLQIADGKLRERKSKIQHPYILLNHLERSFLWPHNLYWWLTWVSSVDLYPNPP